MPVRDQQSSTRLDLMQYIRQWGSRMQKLVNSTGELRKLSEQTHLMPHFTDLSRQANGDRPSHWTRIGHQILAAARSGADDATLRRIEVELRSLLERVRKARGTRPHVPELIVRHAEEDAEEELLRTRFLAGRRLDPDEGPAYAAALREEAAAAMSAADGIEMCPEGVELS